MLLQRKVRAGIRDRRHFRQMKIESTVAQGRPGRHTPNGPLAYAPGLGFGNVVPYRDSYSRRRSHASVPIEASRIRFRLDSGSANLRWGLKMSDNTDAQICHIYERWHDTEVDRDPDGLMALYAQHAILETPL